ncbi:MAG TPA: hypothetical protein VM597_10185 [Gemmataceae bacterium]|nr:hypothetical protein [Gemmataceae bacterium]
MSMQNGRPGTADALVVRHLCEDPVQPDVSPEPPAAERRPDDELAEGQEDPVADDGPDASAHNPQKPSRRSSTGSANVRMTDRPP